MSAPTSDAIHAATTGRSAVLVAAGAAALSLSATFVKLADVTAGTAAFLRCAIALFALVPLAVREARRSGAMPANLYPIAIMAGVFLGADYIMWTGSILDVGASIATVLINVQVIVLPVLGLVVDRTSISRRFMFAAPCMLLGVAMAGGVIGGSGSAADHAVRGSLLGIAAGVAYAVYLFLNRRSVQRSPRHLVIPVCVSTASAAVTAGIIGAAMDDINLSITAASWGWMVALAMIGQVAAWLVISAGSRSLRIDTVAALLLCQPVLGIVFGYLVLTETPSAVQIFGSAVVVAAVWSATRCPAAPLRAETTRISVDPVFPLLEPRQHVDQILGDDRGGRGFAGGVTGVERE
ncbi:DMT family transporter [Rhodococcus sp. NBC_00297]|uniref:DMT family transporter n=1 Tax=Rhodococcus sp. NBC_00297 TaxID=2976005 RepID=UPI002E2BF7BB|nr:DMT family transporter [Rhodococcus sp. NBC_00297]